MALRRSQRLASSVSANDDTSKNATKRKVIKKASKKSTRSMENLPVKAVSRKRKGKGEKLANLAGKSKADAQPTPKKNRALSEQMMSCLPRLIEKKLLNGDEGIEHVLGIDEAGRGPLAGPVVAAAAIVPTDIAGIFDSKKLTNEELREELYEIIVASPGVRWAVAIVDAQRIDEINILQATLEGMSMAAKAAVGIEVEAKKDNACVTHKGCYVVCGGKLSCEERSPSSVYALVDGNRIPKNLPMKAEAIVKGDSREYAIAAASILAKVTRDRLMHAYDKIYPEYNLSQHKGYPTKAHMQAVTKHGASMIHRRTFAPLKFMELDKDGKVMPDS